MLNLFFSRNELQSTGVQKASASPSLQTASGPLRRSASVTFFPTCAAAALQRSHFSSYKRRPFGMRCILPQISIETAHSHPERAQMFVYQATYAHMENDTRRWMDNHNNINPAVRLTITFPIHQTQNTFCLFRQSARGAERVDNNNGRTNKWCTPWIWIQIIVTFVTSAGDFLVDLDRQKQ